LSNRATATVTILNRLGLHARPAMQFVDTAVAHKCAVTVRKGDQTVDGKSIMQMMMLAATKGSTLEITAEGDGSEKAVEMLKALVESKFGEE
jgi:phosphocarrier protein HPr